MLKARSEPSYNPFCCCKTRYEELLMCLCCHGDCNAARFSTHQFISFKTMTSEAIRYLGDSFFNLLFKKKNFGTGSSFWEVKHFFKEKTSALSKEILHSLLKLEMFFETYQNKDAFYVKFQFA